MSAERADCPFPLAYTPRRREHLYNILLVIVDDLRADHLRAFGYHRETTPHLDRRLAGSTCFRNCRSPVGWTLPGCASIITGQMPDTHGLVDHNHKFRTPKIAHYLRRDYHCGGITNNGNVVTDSIPRETLEQLGFQRRPAKWKFFGWDSGFDFYDWIPRQNHARPYERAREFLDGAAALDRPWFLFFHTNVVHDYHMDRDYYLEARDWLGEDIHPDLHAFRDGPEVWREPPEGLDPDLQIRHIQAKYDAGIRAMDRELETVLARVDFDGTIVIFVSDHGEGFEPGLGRVHHCGRLHEDLTHVPLIIWLPRRLRERYDPPAAEERFCSTLDIAPTTLTLLGDAVSGFPGQFLFDLPAHRRLEGSDRGYIFWNEDSRRESYDTCRIELRSELTYPIKTITVRRNDTCREYAYNLAYDPEEHDNLLEALPGEIPHHELVSFVVAVNDEEELRNNLLSSPVARSRDHDWILVENPENQRFTSISALYEHALKRARHDLVFFIHQDVFLSVGWEARMFQSLRRLEEIDPAWGVLGAVGALPPVPGEPKELKGHWCDPSGYYNRGPLPHEVQALDEQWLGIRQSRGVRFDPRLPGFHCYGLDLSLTARDLGLRSYAIDAFVWHKYKDSDAHLVARREDSRKITQRWSEEFMAGFRPAADYVEKKWKKYLPFQTTSWSWESV